MLQNLEIKHIEKIKEFSLNLFNDHLQKRGVFAEFPFSPEYTLPSGMKKGSEEQLLFITLTVSIDYMRDAEQLWKQSCQAWTNPENKWIFNPRDVVENGLEALIEFFKRIKDRRPTKDAKIWYTICKKLLEFNGSVYKLLEKLNFDALNIDEYLNDNRKDFPYLNGYKIKPLWLRMIHDTAEIKLNRIEKIHIPIDVHTARMTLKIIFNEDFDGNITKSLREKTQKAWIDILKNSQIYPLQLDQPLWLLGKYKLLDKFAKEHNYKFEEFR